MRSKDRVGDDGVEDDDFDDDDDDLHYNNNDNNDDDVNYDNYGNCNYEGDYNDDSGDGTDDDDDGGDNDDDVDKNNDDDDKLRIEAGFPRLSTYQLSININNILFPCYE